MKVVDYTVPALSPLQLALYVDSSLRGQANIVSFESRGYTVPALSPLQLRDCFLSDYFNYNFCEDNSVLIAVRLQRKKLNWQLWNEFYFDCLSGDTGCLLYTSRCV